MNADEGSGARSRQSALRLVGTTDMAWRAREHARGFLAPRERPTPDARGLGDALLVVTELVTNAARHAPGPCVLRLIDEDDCLVIAVSDTSPAWPRPRRPDPETGGYGWHLLLKIARDLTVRAEGDGGKTVVATLPSLHAPRSEAPGGQDTARSWRFGSTVGLSLPS